MRVQLYQIFDTVSSKGLGPIIAQAREAAAIRLFQEVAAAEGTDLNKYPEDFVLLHLGEQDEESATIYSKTPEPIYTGKNYTAAKRIQDLNATLRNSGGIEIQPDTRSLAPAANNAADAADRVRIN